MANNENILVQVKEYKSLNHNGEIKKEGEYFYTTNSKANSLSSKGYVDIVASPYPLEPRPDYIQKDQYLSGRININDTSTRDIGKGDRAFFNQLIDKQAAGAALQDIITNGISQYSYFKGWFPSEASLKNEFESCLKGWYAINGETDTIWIWDTDTNTWIDSGGANTINKMGDIKNAILLHTGRLPDGNQMYGPVNQTVYALTPIRQTGVATKLSVLVAHPGITESHYTAIIYNPSGTAIEMEVDIVIPASLSEPTVFEVNLSSPLSVIRNEMRWVAIYLHHGATAQLAARTLGYTTNMAFYQNNPPGQQVPTSGRNSTTVMYVMELSV